LGGRATAALLVLGLVVVLLVIWARSGDPGAGSTSPAGPAVTLTGPSSTLIGPSSTRTGPSSTRTGPSSRSAARPTPSAAAGSLQAKALAVLAVVDATGAAPSGYVGGRQFMNDGRGGTAPLPRTDGQGRRITYHEYDVNPYRSGVDRGPQRLVVGSDGSAWATGDHYVTWIRLR
jgi:guanyl-specific ribonuclease Sa